MLPATRMCSVSERCRRRRLGPEDIRIRVRATAVNRADLLQRQGMYPPPPGASAILGLECAGEVVEVGSGVAGWQVGDRAMALLAGGGYAQEVVVHHGSAMHVPPGDELRGSRGISGGVPHRISQPVRTRRDQTRRRRPGARRRQRCRHRVHHSAARGRTAFAWSPPAATRSVGAAASWARTWRSTIAPATLPRRCARPPAAAASMWSSTRSAASIWPRTWTVWRWTAAW